MIIQSAINIREKRSKLPSALCMILVSSALCSFVWLQNTKPTLYIIGDSTVRNFNKEQRGWGSFINGFLDTNAISVSNQAMAGRSTRTFIKEGRWDKVMNDLQKGDYVMMQFGHNEGAKPDTSRAGYRGVLRGIEEDTIKLVWKDGTPETVHTYGWYLRKFIREAKSKHATPIIISMIPRNIFKEGRVARADNDFGKWAREVAQSEGVTFIDLNAITADKYDQWGPEKVKELFDGDHTHTNEQGAKVNARSVAEGIRKEAGNPLNAFLALK